MSHLSFAGRAGRSTVWAALGVAFAGVLVNGAGAVAQTAGCSWSQVSSPSPGTADNALSGVAAVSANDVWTVGYSKGAGAYQTLV